MNDAIARRRLRSHRLHPIGRGTAEETVGWFGAVQAQDHHAARWAVSLRSTRTSQAAAIDQALQDGRVLRTHVLRPTWHFVAAPDLRWLLALTAPRVHRSVASIRRRVGPDTAACVRACRLFERWLAGGRHLTRNELAAHLGRAGLPLKGVPLALATMFAELEGVLCSGAWRNQQPTYALLDERAPSSCEPSIETPPSGRWPPAISRATVRRPPAIWPGGPG